MLIMTINNILKLTHEDIHNKCWMKESDLDRQPPLIILNFSRDVEIGAHRPSTVI